MLTYADMIWFLISLLIGFGLKRSFSKNNDFKGRSASCHSEIWPTLTKMLSGSITPTGAVVLWGCYWKNVYRGANKSTSTHTLCQQKRCREGLRVLREMASRQDFKIFIGLQTGDGCVNVLTKSIYYWQYQYAIPKRGHSLQANRVVQGIVSVVSLLLGDRIKLPSTIFVCRSLNGHWL